MKYKWHRFLAWLGRIPKNHFNPNYDYSHDYIGTWPINIARRIAKNLKRHGYIYNLRGRTPKPGTSYSLFGTLKLTDAQDGAIYVRNLEKLVCEDCGYKQAKRVRSPMSTYRYVWYSSRSFYHQAGKLLCVYCTQKPERTHLKREYFMH